MSFWVMSAGVGLGVFGGVGWSVSVQTSLPDYCLGPPRRPARRDHTGTSSGDEVPGGVKTDVTGMVRCAPNVIRGRQGKAVCW